jgi:hypothetical protein
MTPDDPAIYSQADIEEAVRVAIDQAIREERERCARIADEEATAMTGVMSSSVGYSGVARRVAAAIRKGE